MKKLLLLLIVLLLAYLGANRKHPLLPPQGESETRVAASLAGAPAPVSATLSSAIREQRSGLQVEGEGVVSKVLTDDNNGSRHQRFILTLSSGQTLLVAHNIDLAPRVAGLREGDTVAFNGVYEWNPKGGVIHWTHHDPGGQHEPGWLRHAGQTYQ